MQAKQLVRLFLKPNMPITRAAAARAAGRSAPGPHYADYDDDDFGGDGGVGGCDGKPAGTPCSLRSVLAHHWHEALTFVESEHHYSGVTSWLRLIM